MSGRKPGERSSVQILDEVVARAIRDTDFRQQLTSDPKKTLEEEGLSEEELSMVSGGTAMFANISAVFADNGAINKIARVAYCTDSPGPPYDIPNPADAKIKGGQGNL